MCVCFIHVSVSDLYIPRSAKYVFCFRKYVNRFWKYVNRSQTHECGTEAAQFLSCEYMKGIFVAVLLTHSVLALLCKSYTAHKKGVKKSSMLVMDHIYIFSLVTHGKGRRETRGVAALLFYCAELSGWVQLVLFILYSCFGRCESILLDVSA
jgi:hypothetical protein